MDPILITVLLILLTAILILLWLIFQFLKKRSGENENLLNKLESWGKENIRIEQSVRQEIVSNRYESNEAARLARTELADSLRYFGDQLGRSLKEGGERQKSQLETFSKMLEKLTASVEQKLETLTLTVEGKLKEASESGIRNSKDTRLETKTALEEFGKQLSDTVFTFNTNQKDNFYALLEKQTDQNKTISHRLDQMRETLEKKMAEMQSGNEKKLEEMRATVDEKLQKTLEVRLGESFKLVSERLEAVHKGLGDMQQLATGVGDLKRVLTNVKSRGMLGEYQLGNILEEILTPDQYSKNVKTKQGSGALVEFAVKLPGREQKDQPVWLPVDSKFPKEDFELLMDAYDQALPDLIEERRRNFVRGIKKCAAEISGKYIDPPFTTDFAILFLPFESLYAEVLRTVGLFESLQRECRIIITGPATLSALLNSLQMGFRTLAIEKRSSEVWDLLRAVKTDFGNFGQILEKTQKKLQEASNVIEQAGVRSRSIERKLKNVQELPSAEPFTGQPPLTFNETEE